MTHAIGTGTVNISVNCPTDERSEIGKLAFRLGFRSVGDCMRHLVLKGAEQVDAPTAEKVREIRRRYYSGAMLGLFVSTLVIGHGTDLRRPSRRTPRPQEIREEA